MNEKQKIISDAKRWIGQEKVWDDQILATWSRANLAAPAAVAPTPVNIAQDAGKTAALKALYEAYKDCTRCNLGHTRIKFVFGVGNPNSKVLFIGEGPGYEEDRRGEPFVGKAGQLLDKMIAAIGLSRQTNAYIANIVKCHPMANPQTPEARGNDRAPNPDEVDTCAPILLQQIKIMKPLVIVTLGSPSTKMILKTKDGITGLRGRYFPFPVDQHYPSVVDASLFAEEGKSVNASLALSPAERAGLAKIQVLPTYHPAALLRNPNLKPESWEDLKLLRATLSQNP